MKLLLFIFSICQITHHSLAYGADSFSFSGIQWTDTREMISKKLKETKEFEGLRKNAGSKERYHGYEDFPRDLLKINKLREIDNKLNECNYEAIVRVIADINMNFSNDDGIISRGSNGGAFYFSAFDEKLLYYIINTKGGEVKDSVRQSLQNKYGPGRDFSVGDYKFIMWERDNELLFFADKNWGLLYINTKNLMDIVEPCIKAKNAETEKNNAKASKLSF